MPARPLAMLVVAAAAAGCTRYQSRGQAPARPLPSPYAARPVAAPPGRAAALELPAVSTAATAPGQPTEPSLVPPPPREPMPNGAVVQPPLPPGARNGVVPVAGTLPPVSSPPDATPGLAGQPGRSERDNARPEPDSGSLPSPFAGSATPPPAANGNFLHVRRLAATAAQKWQTVSTYEARLVRREVVGNKPMPEEEVQYQLRREPFAVHLKNVGEVGKGREVIYNPSQFKDLMHIVVGAGDSFFMKAGSRAPDMSPDSPLVTQKSRQNIRDAGFGSAIARFHALVERAASGRGSADALMFAGAQVRNDMPGFTLEAVTQKIAAGEEPLLPRGGVRYWFFDARPESASFGLPVLVVTQDGRQEVEYYRFDRFRLPAGLTDADFDPNRMGKK